ncbi:MAG: DUF1570 domain-containing protein [Planctomycetaceae bacterium]|jgi:hypothetical protein|nr:DUF1570 domain-containing protein [Planctomycetaceae bacterium]
MKIVQIIITFPAVFIAAFFCHSGLALDMVTVRLGKAEEKLEGRIIAEDIEGNLVLENRAGAWFKVEKDHVAARTSDARAFVPYTQEEMIPLLKQEFPEPFQVLQTKRYLIVYDTSPAYAQWCGSQLERLQTAFVLQWKRKGFELHEPEFPLTTILFANRKDFILYVKREFADIGETIAAYYNLNTNRIVCSDLTGMERYGEGGNRLTPSQKREFLSRRGAAQSISTFVHEATHQIAFNSGIHQRYGACPLWLSEGIAMLYEPPDLDSIQGWSADIKINPVRLYDLREFMQKNPRDVIRKMICSDEALRNPETIHDHYATAWALVYYLSKKRSKEFTKYVRRISEKPPFEQDPEEKRLEDFESIFGSDWPRFYREFTKYVMSL